ncbi:hypothetical protein ALC60_07887 [Trachymyrmex zeteki]|uniref:Uncharacterized protein n=1 Tax=Mycetomoellerius zeteki TaxID=64791 RepID=A0A151WZG7_9HYME|nr:hypothetical protein ALC60_07887 [Trachymyrmex zeteki]
MVAESPERAVCSSFHKPPVCISLHTVFQGNTNASALLVTGLFSLIDYLNLGLRIILNHIKLVMIHGLREKQKLARSLHRTFPSGPTFSGSHPFCLTHTRRNRAHNTLFIPISKAGGKLEPALLTTSSRCRPFATSRTSTQHPVAFTADPGPILPLQDSILLSVYMYWMAHYRILVIKGDFDVKDAPRSGKSIEIDDDKIEAFDSNRCLITRKITKSLNISKSNR